MKNDIYIIAEIGINHNGSIEIAKQMMKMAKECGCDAVKFQKRNLDIVIPKEEWYKKKDTLWGYIDYIDYKRHLEFGESEYDEINRYSKDIDIDWFASAWDLDSLEFLKKYDNKYNKVASAMLTNIPFIEAVAKQGKKTLISTGLSTIEDIDKAVNIFRDNNCPFILMHCVSLYPCPNDKLNLRMINTLRDRYNCEIGYSGHSPGILDSIVASLLGAKYIEKHITLESSMWGSDQSASLERKGLEYTVRDVRIMETILGDGKLNLSDKEKEIAKKLRYW